MMRRVSSSAFSLVELLVVLAIIAVLAAMLLPVISRARVAARIVRAHADLAQIDQALGMYMNDNRQHLPPTRFSCSSRAAFELPVELFEHRYLPWQWDGEVRKVRMYDVFSPGQTYLYRAPGPAIMNEFTFIPNGSRLYVPDYFPRCDSPTGRYYDDPQSSPVRYAIWSVGPDPYSPKFAEDFGRAPVPQRFWCMGSGDSGLIVHIRARNGQVIMSP